MSIPEATAGQGPNSLEELSLELFEGTEEIAVFHPELVRKRYRDIEPECETDEETLHSLENN